MHVMTILYVNGCSFSSLRTLLPYESRPAAWPEVLGKIIECDVINHAFPSISNDRIFRTSFEWISQNLREDIMVIIQPTEIYRKEFMVSNNDSFNWIKLKNGSLKRQNHNTKHLSSLVVRFAEIHEKYFTHTIQCQINTLNYLISLQMFLESNNIKYWFLGTEFKVRENYYYCSYNSFDDCNLKNMVNWDKWINSHYVFEGDSQEYYSDMWMDEWHINNKGHEKLAIQIYDHILK